MELYPNTRVLIFGGTGSLGKVLLKRLTEKCKYIATFSRDEAKKVAINQLFPDVYTLIGDIRDYDAVERAIRALKPSVIINAAALKNVPESEEYPFEFVKTNIIGSQNLILACEKFDFIQVVISVSTDKAAKPVNAYGMSKALQEKIHLSAKLEFGKNFNCVRYGNVLQSRGSVIPFFRDRLEKGLPLTVTRPDMTRFFLDLEESVDLIFKAIETYETHKIFIPKVKSAKIDDLAQVLIDTSDKPNTEIQYIDVRAGEKIHEILVSEEEISRCEERDDVIVIHPYGYPIKDNGLNLLAGIGEYCSNRRKVLMDKEELEKFLRQKGIVA